MAKIPENVLNVLGECRADGNLLYDLLDAGGILVAIMCESTFFRTDKKSVEFRDFLDSVYAQAIKLEPGAFRESGTDVVTRIVKIRKPM